MQQPMPQHDQMNAQQAQQQMVLCPVRLVYETQILVPPGDQIQPNQTLFINPQNPPPWAQTRQFQPNPVIYVQQLPNNIMPTVPQQMEQQIYVPQYQNYQQIIPQQVIQNPHENRPSQIQIPNLIHPNMLANYQTNIGQNIQLQDRGMQQVHFAPTHPNVGANIQMQNQQINLANTRQNEAMPSPVQQVPQQNQNNQANQRAEVKQTYQNTNMGQVNQTPNMARSQPQVLTVTPMQNLPQTVNIQTFVPNVINRPIKTENASSQVSMPTYVNASQNTNITRIRKVAPVININKMNAIIRNASQPYRQIQPRPYRNQYVNYPIEFQTQNIQNMPVISQGVVNINSNVPSTQTVVPVSNIPMQPQTQIRPEENTRKRKSESPDEIHKKMASIQFHSNIVIKPINKAPSAEMGTNTSPVHKKSEKVSMSLQYSDQNSPETDNMSTLIQNVQNAIQIDKVNMTKSNEDTDESTQNNADKEKLIRNTVFTQARGRVLTDKELHNIGTINEVNITIKNDKPPTHDDNKAETNNSVTIKEVPDTAKIHTDKPFKITNVVKNNKFAKKEREMDVSLNTTNNKGMFPMGKCEKEKDYILTHVLDGIVIQESNIAFPIREPLTRRVVHQIPAAVTTERKTRRGRKSKEKKEEEVPIEQETEPSPVASNASDEDIPLLELVAQSGTQDPFSNISPETLKSWTTSDLSAHLTKHKWEEAAALFQEHEIDGESLFLVSKAQLQNIGVKEDQAEVICAFVMS